MSEQRPQQESPRPDPFELWRQYYEANEQIWTKAMKDVMTTPGYAESQGKMLEIFLAYQRMMREAMSAQLNSLNLPTRDDVSRLGELIVGFEEKADQIADRLADLEDKVEQLGERSAAGDEQQNQTVQRLTSIEKLIGRLAGLNERVDQLLERLVSSEKKLDRAVEQVAGLDRKLGRFSELEAGMTRLDERMAGLADQPPRESSPSLDGQPSSETPRRRPSTRSPKSQSPRS